MNIWDEKNYTEQKRSCSSNKENDQTDIIKNAAPASEKDACGNTGWTRNCPQCKKIIIYKCEKQLRVSILRNTKCKSCAKIGNSCRKGIPHSEETKKKIAYTNSFRRHTPESIEKIRKGNIGRVVSVETRNKLRKHNLGKKASDITKRKCVENYLRQKNLCGKFFFPSFSERACEYFDWLNKWTGWNGLHALNGGEKRVLGYFLDYYEPTQNIAIEWDEKLHRQPKQKEKDIKRQNLIKEHLKCKFFRYDELTKTITEV